ncbi:TIGR04255 family protein [Thalassospira profundimaris]|uniref:TIGR04255 family protein n=1 Tax=Thalassospira profundimaris TaxID=502049 RepID=UPI0002872544|nr:TIGR04255 family protein [Thalassospira profundimaris]EKF10194.1 hypothetical protein TH2_02470 [Thalassospira profundimaris WP0211]
MPLPSKLKEDCIVEALLELRFQSNELPEVIMAKIVDGLGVENFSRQQLPIADVPWTIRQQDPNLKHQPTVVFISENNKVQFKVGPSVLSVHNVGEYAGWENISKVFADAAKLVCTKIQSKIERCGLRYVNIVNPQQHYIENFSDLNVSVVINGNTQNPPLNVNYMLRSDGTAVVVRACSPEFVTPRLPEGSTAFIDIDVSTTDNGHTENSETVVKWLETAHDFEKKEFFKLLPAAAIEKLAVYD